MVGKEGRSPHHPPSCLFHLKFFYVVSRSLIFGSFPEKSPSSQLFQGSIVVTKDETALCRTISLTDLYSAPVSPLYTPGLGPGKYGLRRHSENYLSVKRSTTTLSSLQTNITKEVSRIFDDVYH